MILVSYCLKLAATARDEKFLICRFVRKIYQMSSWISCKAQIKKKKKKKKKKIVASARAQLRF